MIKAKQSHSAAGGLGHDAGWDYAQLNMTDDEFS